MPSKFGTHRLTFRYTDFFRPPRKWERIRVDEIDAKLEGGNVDVFALIQRFRSGAQPELGAQEVHWCPIYFDFDAEKDLDDARRDAMKVVEFFRQLGTPKECVRIWFSGNRGFHIAVEPEAFGIEPSENLTYIIRQLCNWIANRLALTTFDHNVYTRRRQWRIPNSIHSKSKLRCLELDYLELAGSKPDEIRKLAENPREPFYTDDDYLDHEPVDSLAQLWKSFVDEYVVLDSLRRISRTQVVTPETEAPVCVRDVLTKSIRRRGDRNKATVVLASFYKDSGVSQDDAEAKIAEWALRISGELTDATKHEILLNTKSVIQSVYRGRDYHFACGYIRSLGTEKNPVECNQCTVGKVAAHEIVETTLADSALPEFAQSTQRLRAGVIGLDTTPYHVPKSVQIRCTPKESCAGCPLSTLGSARFEFSDQDPDLSHFVFAGESQRKGHIKRLANIRSKCYAVSVEELEKFSIFDVVLAPAISVTLKDNLSQESQYVTRHALVVAKHMDSNREYEFVGKVIPDPRSGQALLFAWSATPLQSDIDIQSEPSERLDVFRPKENTYPACVAKLAEIYDDLACSVLRIYDRHPLFLSYYLAFCSPLGFVFDDEVIKGWADIMVLGDTATGKTVMIERMMQHFNAGQIIGGETSKRTGLVYSTQQLSSSGRWQLVWGVIPRQDRRLLAIDEFHEVDAEESQKISRLRTSGIAEVIGVASGKTYARTRLIFICNPKRRNTDIADLNYPILGVNDAMPQREDVRRLDMALIVSRDDVALSVLTSRHSASVKTHVFASDLCSELVKFIWTRKPEQVVFESEALDDVMHATKFLLGKFTSKIPLVEPGDLRYKVARLAAAVAAGLYSERDGNIVVLPCHVEVAYSFLEQIYIKSGYDIYTTMVSDVPLSEEDKAEIRGTMNSILPTSISGTPFVDMRSFVMFLLTNMVFKRTHLAEVLGITRRDEVLNAFMALCTKYNLLRLSSNGGFRKTPKFIRLLREILNDRDSEPKGDEENAGVGREEMVDEEPGR